MQFIGRNEEIKILKESYKTDNYKGIVVYGRRRIGKSELSSQKSEIQFVKKMGC